MRLLAPAIVCILTWTPAVAQQATPRWQTSLSTFVSEGNYGTFDTTRLLYTTLSVRRSLPRGDVTVRIPQLNVTTAGTVLVYRGVPQIPSRSDAVATTRQTQTITRGSASTVPQVAVPEARITRAAGVGDVSIGGRIYLVEDDGRRPTIDLVTRLEVPTGDETRGLGLGTAAAQLGLDVQKSLGRHVIALASASYTATGHVDGVSLQNPWEYSAGLGIYLTRALLLTGAYEQWRPIIPGTPAGRDVLTTATVAAGRHFRVLLSAQMPLSDQASDFGAGAGLAVRF